MDVKVLQYEFCYQIPSEDAVVPDDILLIVNHSEVGKGKTYKELGFGIFQRNGNWYWSVERNFFRHYEGPLDPIGYYELQLLLGEDLMPVAVLPKEETEV